MYKSRKEPPDYWQHRGNSFNYHVGYNEGKNHPNPNTWKSLVVCMDREIKSGANNR